MKGEEQLLPSVGALSTDNHLEETQLECLHLVMDLSDSEGSVSLARGTPGYMASPGPGEEVAALPPKHVLNCSQLGSLESSKFLHFFSREIRTGL